MPMITPGDIALTLIALLFIGLAWSARRREARLWNNGTCPRCGSRWRLTSTNSTGDRHYTDRCGNSIWISYRVDKPRSPRPIEEKK